MFFLFGRVLTDKSTNFSYLEAHGWQVASQSPVAVPAAELFPHLYKCGNDPGGGLSVSGIMGGEKDILLYGIIHTEEINMNRKIFRQTLVSSLFVLFLTFDANAWMDKWAPAFKSTAADVQALSATSVSNYVCSAREDFELCCQYCKGYTLDLNDDGIKDQVFILPWMGCGLNASGYDVHFIVSDGAKGRKKTIMEGYGVEKSDFVKVAGKTYFRHSMFFNQFEKSDHNHWVYQMFSFDKNGAIRCSNGDFGKQFPAVTIFYINPKFKQIELTKGDLKKIAAETKPKAR